MTPSHPSHTLWCKTNRRQRGIAAVEVVLAAPLLLLLLIGVIEVSNAFMQYNTLVKSTQTAARYIASHATPGNTNLIDLGADEIDTGKQLLVYGITTEESTPQLDGLTVDQVTIWDVDGTHIGVTVNYAYQPLFGGLIPGFFGPAIDSNFSFTATSVMRAL